MECDGCPLQYTSACVESDFLTCHITPAERTIIKAIRVGKWRCEECEGWLTSCNDRDAAPCGDYQPRKETPGRIPDFWYQERYSSDDKSCLSICVCEGTRGVFLVRASIRWFIQVGKYYLPRLFESVEEFYSITEVDEFVEKMEEKYIRISESGKNGGDLE